MTFLDNSFETAPVFEKFMDRITTIDLGSLPSDFLQGV